MGEEPVFKVGREVLDPHNRVVVVTAVDGDTVTVRLAGSYGAHVRFTRSLLRAVPAEDRDAEYLGPNRTYRVVRRPRP
jgi:endonuclease YncB( thermonuclease family)